MMFLTSTVVTLVHEGRGDPLIGVTITIPDDYGTISEALAHVNDGDVIQVRAGTWQMGINIFKQITLRSMAGADVTFLETSSYYGIYLYTRARVDGFTLSQASTSLLVDSNSHGSNVSNCIFLNTSVQVQAASVEFWNNTIIGDPAYGYQLSWSGEGASIVENKFSLTGDLYLTGDNASISGNEFDNAEAAINGDSSSFSHNLMANTNYEALTVNGNNCTIYGNTFRDIGRRAIVLQSGPNSVQYNHFLRCQETGVYVTGSAYGGEANDIGWNTFDECKFAVQISSQSGTHVHNNTILNGNPDGTGESNIRVTSDLNIIENNTLYGCRKAGISIRSEGNVIRYNNVSAGIGKLDSAIAVYEANNIVHRNELFQNDGNGILSYGDDCNISRNKVMFNDNYGIRIFATGCWVVWNDLIYNNHTAESDAGNHWDYNLYSDYNGPDATNDGIGDLPYSIPYSGVEDVHPRYLKATNVGEVNLGIVPFTYNDVPADGAVQYDEQYYLDLGEKIAAYFYEVSYGHLIVSVQVLSDGGGSWYKLPYGKAQLLGFSGNANLVDQLISMVDDDHDLRAYDYNPSGGLGCLAFVASADIDGDDSSFIWGARRATGDYGTNDSTSVDYIYSYTPRFNGANKTVRALCHEYGHFLGKALTTAPQNSSRDEEWMLPDEYLMGRLTCYDSLMGALTNRSLERVHLDSYTKEWLGWLTYENLTVGSNVSVPALPLLGFGGTVYCIPFDLPGRDYKGFLILEYRTNSSDVSEWDTQTKFERALQISIVQIVSGGSDKINPFKTMEYEGIANPPWLGSVIRLAGLNDTHAAVELIDPTPSNLTGAVMDGNGTVSGAAGAVSRHDYSGWIGYPDTDLHARDKFGRHVGVNQTTGLYEAYIPGAEFSGDLLNGLEWIYVPAELEPEFWVDAADTQKFFADNPQYSGLAQDEEFAIMVQHLDAQGGETNTEMRVRSVAPGDLYHADYSLTISGSEVTVVLDDSVHTVTFHQSGLPAGTDWSVTIDSWTHSTITNEISVLLVSDEYQYTIGDVTGYEADPSDGTLVLGDENVTVEIEFSADAGAGMGMDIIIVIVVAVAAVGVVAALFLRRGKKK